MCIIISSYTFMKDVKPLLDSYTCSYVSDKCFIKVIACSYIPAALYKD